MISYDNKINSKRVTFDLFTEVIFIPRYTVNFYNNIWWNIDEMKIINSNANIELNNFINKYPNKTLQQVKKILY